MIEGRTYGGAIAGFGGGAETAGLLILTDEELARVPADNARITFGRSRSSTGVVFQATFLSERLPNTNRLTMTCCSKTLALAMGMHPRLGQDSPLRMLDTVTLDYIRELTMKR